MSLADRDQPDAENPFAAPRTFTPVCLLSRAQLPLAYLDTGASGSRLFAAYVHALEAAHDHDDGATVLVAAETKAKKLYAVERVKRRVYALCRLGEWVGEGDVIMRSKCVMQNARQVKRRAVQVGEEGGPWWTSAAVDMPEMSQYANKAKLKIDLKPTEGKIRTETVPVYEGQLMSADPAAGSFQDTVPADVPPQSPTDVLQELARHYLEALYLSRTSLAYFTKGPLSRARAAFAAMSAPSANLELVNFLRGSILTSSTMDKKFKDHVSTTVKEVADGVAGSPEQPKKSKRKRKWKVKRDKYGFFTDEKDAVARWWLENDAVPSVSSSSETLEESLRRRLPKLRSRETFMQLILILEALALEVVVPTDTGLDSVSDRPWMEPQAVDTHLDDTQGVEENKSSKPKKKQDLCSLLETLLDKLCIWHSLESHSPAKKSDPNGDDRDEANDELKSFCIEVVVPFYASRIPERASVVNKKFGGPSPPTPVKHRSTAARKPGEPASRPAPEKKPRKPLSRVVTDTLNRNSKTVPALIRSATDTETLHSYIKRESSEVPLESIPAANQQRKPRQSLMHTLDSSRRQVDLNAMSQANDAKMQKKAEMQEKMQSAINMLRKPNRAAALAEIRSQTDESFAKATAASKSRSGAAGQKARTAHRPQIAATPSHKRTVKSTPYRREVEARQSEHAMSSGTTHVPSSSARLLPNHDIVPTSSFAIPQTGRRPRQTAMGSSAAGVEETPSRGFAKFMPAGLAREPGTLDSPIVSRKIVTTPSKPVRTLSLGVGATPVHAALVAASPNVQRQDTASAKGTGTATSIYDSLGWDEEYEELA